MTVLAQARIFRMDLPAPLTELGATFVVSGYAAYATGSAAEVLATDRTPRRLDVVTDAPVDVAALLASSAELVDVSLPPLHLSDSMVDLWLPGGSPLRIRTVLRLGCWLPPAPIWAVWLTCWPTCVLSACRLWR